MDQLAWHHVHNEAYRRLGGVAAVNRIDNLKTGVARGCGAWGVVNDQYRAYARALGFHVDACEVGVTRLLVKRQPQGVQVGMLDDAAQEGLVDRGLGALAAPRRRPG